MKKLFLVPKYFRTIRNYLRTAKGWHDFKDYARAACIIILTTAIIILIIEEVIN